MIGESPVEERRTGVGVGIGIGASPRRMVVVWLSSRGSPGGRSGARGRGDPYGRAAAGPGPAAAPARRPARARARPAPGGPAVLLPACRRPGGVGPARAQAALLLAGPAARLAARGAPAQRRATPGPPLRGAGLGRRRRRPVGHGDARQHPEPRRRHRDRRNHTDGVDHRAGAFFLARLAAWALFLFARLCLCYGFSLARLRWSGGGPGRLMGEAGRREDGVL